MEESSSKVPEADKIVNRYMLGAGAAGLVPLPVFDLVAITGIQLKMLHSLANLYELPFQDDLGKSLLSSLGSGSLSVMAGPRLAQAVLKVIPGFQLATGISIAALGAATTYAAGKAFTQHFEAGGTLLNFDAEEMRAYFTEKLHEGKTVATTQDYTGVKP